MLNPTPKEQMVDEKNCPYFLADCGMTLEKFQRGLDDPNPEARAYLLGKLMREARPDDVFSFVSPRKIRENWPEIEHYLGKEWAFWNWLFEVWEELGLVWR